MDRGFLKNWDSGAKEPVFSGVSGHFRHKVPVKEQLSSAIYRIRVQQNKLEAASMRMQQHDKEIFSKCVNAQMVHDSPRAAMYANECAEVRKIAKVTLQCQMALEQVSLRLETIEEFGDIAKMMGPVASVVNSIKHQISGIMPEVGFELSEISETLNGFVVEAGEATSSYVEMGANGTEAQKILNEANTIAEQHMKERFPDLPMTGSGTRLTAGEAGLAH